MIKFSDLGAIGDSGPPVVLVGCAILRCTRIDPHIPEIRSFFEIKLTFLESENRGGAHFNSPFSFSKGKGEPERSEGFVNHSIPIFSPLGSIHCSNTVIACVYCSTTNPIYIRSGKHIVFIMYEKYIKYWNIFFWA